MCREAQVRSRTWFFQTRFHQQGLSLAELLSVLGITAVLSTTGVDSYRSFVGNAKADREINSLRTALALARSEAVTRDQKVVLCRKDPIISECIGKSSEGRVSWVSGWLLFIDGDDDRLYSEGGNDQLLRVFPPLADGALLKWNRGDYIGYQGSGSLSSLNGTFCLWWDSDDNFRRELKIPYTGRVRLTTGECSYEL